MSNHHPSGIPTLDDIKIAVIGLGYVGLPLARLFSTRYPTIGYDLDKHRVDALMQGHDTTLEVEDDMLQKALDAGFRCTSSIEEIRNCNFYVVAVPSPVDENNRCLRIHGLSRRYGRRMPSCHRSGFRIALQSRLLCWIQP